MSDRSPEQKTVRYGEDFGGAAPVTVVGHLRNAKEIHTVQIEGQKGGKYRAEVRSKQDGFLLDSNLVIRDAKTGDQLASNDDVSRGGYDAGVDFTPKEDGPIDIELSDMVDDFGPRHFYRLLIRKVVPGFTLSVASGRFAMEPDKSLEIPVSVARVGGFAGMIKLSVQGLPDGVVVDPVISEAKGDTSKSVKLKLTSSGTTEWNGPIRIVGVEVDDAKSETGEHRSAEFSLRPSIPIKEIWLTVVANEKKEDK